MQIFLIIFSLIFGFFILLKSFIVVNSCSVCAMFRFGKFQKSYGPGVHFVLDAFTLKHVVLTEGMRVGIVSNQEIEIGAHRLSAIFLEDPLIGNSGLIVGFENSVPRVSQKEISYNKLEKLEANSQNTNRISMGHRALLLIFSIIPLIEGYNTLTTGYTILGATRHGNDGTLVEGSWATFWGVFFILFGLFMIGAALGIIKRRKRAENR